MRRTEWLYDNCIPACILIDLLAIGLLVTLCIVICP
jgi:hypothetical protein